MAVIGTALQLVFARRGYVLGGVLATLLTAALYAYAGQIVTIFGDGTIFIDPDPTRLAALVVLALLMGLTLPAQIYAVRRAAWTFRPGGTGLLGFIAGLGSLTCCSPLVLPALLSFVGFSGSALLSLNVTLYRYFGPLAALSIALLSLSLVLVARDITRACTVAPVQKQPGRAGSTSTREAKGADSRRESPSVGRPGQPVQLTDGRAARKGEQP